MKYLALIAILLVAGCVLERPSLSLGALEFVYAESENDLPGNMMDCYHDIAVRLQEQNVTNGIPFLHGILTNNGQKVSLKTSHIPSDDLILHIYRNKATIGNTIWYDPAFARVCSQKNLNAALVTGNNTASIVFESGEEIEFFGVLNDNDIGKEKNVFCNKTYNIGLAVLRDVFEGARVTKQEVFDFGTKTVAVKC